MDLSTSDTTAVRSFYTGLFGWTADEPQEEFGGYFMFNGAGGQPVAGCMPAMEGAARDIWSVYLAVDDVSKALESVPARGIPAGGGFSARTGGSRGRPARPVV